MRTVLIIFFSLLSYPLLAQEKYGFGLVVIYNDSTDGMLTKQIVFTEVLNLDSLCDRTPNISGAKRKRKRYFDCLEHFVVQKLQNAAPAIVQQTSEIVNISQVERFSRVQTLKAKHRHVQMKDGRKIEFMDRRSVETNRRAMLEIASRDATGKVILIN